MLFNCAKLGLPVCKGFGKNARQTGDTTYHLIKNSLWEHSYSLGHAVAQV